MFAILMLWNIRYVCIIIFLSNWLLAEGQPHPHSYDVELILPDQLIKHTHISGIAEDPEGYIWLASYKGLTCYDGHKLIHYNNQYTTDSIFLSREGTGYKTLTSNDNGLHLWTVENETKNIVVFNTRQRKIVKTYLNANQASKYLFAARNEIFKIDELDKVINVSCLTDQTCKPLEIQNQEVHIVINSTPTDQKVITKNAIVSINSLGDIVSESIRSGYFYKILDSLQNSHTISPATKYHITFDDEVWLTNLLRAVGLYDSTTKEYQDYTREIDELVKSTNVNALKGGIISIIKSRQDVYYILYSNSLLKLSPKLPEESQFLEPISSNKSYVSMRQITEDNEGNIYASFYTGVAVKPKGGDRFTDFRKTKNAPKDKEATYSLTYYDDHLIWNTTIFDLKDGEDTYVRNSRYGKHINHFLEEDTLWLFSWHDNTWLKHEFSTGITKEISRIERNDFNEFSGIVKDDKGNFWATTDRAGLLNFDRSGQVLKTFNFEKLGLKYEDDFLYGIHLEGDKIYFGTQKGLGVLDVSTDVVTTISMPYSNAGGQLLERKVYSIFPYKNGLYYLGTDHGLALFDSETLNFQVLSAGHPLANKEYNRNSAFKARDGRFYMGTVDGLYSFVPEELTFDEEAYSLPLPKIHNLQIYNKKNQKKRDVLSNWDKTKMVTLRPSDQNIKLEFSSPSGHNVYYSYRIKGLQEEWSNLALNGNIEIYVLPVGTFDIELKAQHSPQRTASAVSKLTIIKPQYWYLRWWALLAYGLSVLGIVSTLVRRRYKKQLERAQEMQRLRTKISSDLHDDVGSLLGGIAIQSDLMATVASDALKAKLEDLSNSSRQAMELMRDIVWAIDSRKDKYENLLDRMRGFAETTLGVKQISYTFNTENIDGKEPMRPEVRQNVYLIFKESLTNITKHSSADHVHISMQKTNTKYQLIIHDNGRNLENMPNTDGQGLINMKMRAERINGQIKFDRQDGYKVIVSF